MREIKFRAFGKNSKEFLCDEQGYGLTLKEIQNIEKIDDWGLSQFTGLKDKNGKEIYEGDILTRKNVRMEVLYRNDNYLVRWFNTWKADAHKPAYVFKRLLWATENECEVIGNIFENPDLLPTNSNR